MPLPPSIDEMISHRFGVLLADSKQLIQNMEQEYQQTVSGVDRWIGDSRITPTILLEDAFYDLRTNFLSLLELLNCGERIVRLREEVRELESHISDAKKLSGIIKGLKEDYRVGMLQNLSEMIEAEVTADYLGQAEQLLQEGYAGKYDQVPAAVLLGAILEDSLRRLCQRQSPPVTLVKSDGQHKTLNRLIDDLKKAELYNELKAKQLKVWAGIRNLAAHGEFEKVRREDVDRMLAGVQEFLANYL